MSTVPYHVKAIYEYSSPHDDDLSFPQGQIINVTEEEDDDWYSGEFTDSTGKTHRGIFPRNFVEKYEPAVPSRPARPVRAKKDTETLTPAEVTATTQSTPTDAEAAKREHGSSSERPTEVSSPPLSSLASPPSTQSLSHQSSTTIARKPAEQPSAESVNRNASAEVTERSNGGSFKDRIAAFNKPAAPPVAPFKPGGPGIGSSTGFIKKPFVAPPPSKNAYVPPPREPPPAKVYRREEDPDLNETADDSEASMPLPGEKLAETGDHQSKPTSLKDRIALLQKQQLEQAARHAEIAQKKEKPKRPSKKRVDSQEHFDASEEIAEADADDRGTSDRIVKKTVDFADDESEPLDTQGVRQNSNLAHVSTPPPPSRELMSDTNDADNSAAGDTEEADDTSTSREDNRDKSRKSHPTPKKKEHAIGDPGTEESEGEREEEQDVDPELKRRMEIRERMAKMSGGMGLMGMFGPPGGMPMPGMQSRVNTDVDRDVSGTHEQSEAFEHAPPIPVPGMSSIKGLERKATQTNKGYPVDEEVRRESALTGRSEADDSDIEKDEPSRPAQMPRTSLDRTAPIVSQGRAVPPPPPRDLRTPPPAAPLERSAPETPSSSQGRAAPPPPPRSSMPLSPGELSDDEMSAPENSMSQENLTAEAYRPSGRDVPAISTAPPVPTRPEQDTVLSSPTSPTSPATKDVRMSRGPPPLPPSSPTAISSQQFRAPPPPPPGQPPSRKSTSQSRPVPFATAQEAANESEGEVTEYDGDYDTDIASGVKHKDALKSHARDSSLDEDTIVDPISSQPPVNPPGRGPPPLPNVSAPRDIPPVPPSDSAKKHPRKSGDMPRAAPPPIPPPKTAPNEDDQDDYDPYRQPASAQESLPRASSRLRSPIIQPPEASYNDDDDLYDTSPRSTRAPPFPPTQGPPPSIPISAPQSYPNMQRQSLDISRSQTTTRRSMEVPRPSAELGFMATDIDLSPSSQWYAQTPDVPPPSLQSRNDILFEIESSTSSKRGGKTTISKDIYILYMDYSQTIITANFDPLNPTNAVLEQRHERPPPPPRQDQLEAASHQFGAQIASSASSKDHTTLGDGTPHALILALLQPLSPAVLQPVGTRAYGAPVYANLANASTQQFDEIRPGDIVTFRNAKFAGHQGRLHTKYSVEVGKPDHVAVVADWDGTKKKIRVWEQKGKGVGGGGKEKEKEKEVGAKVKEESYRVADLKSGEVRVWRVMGRGWVGWDAGLK